MSRLLLSLLIGLSAVFVPFVADASPGATCANIDECDSGESCHNNVCRTSCTSNPDICPTGMSCELFAIGASARVCLPQGSGPQVTCSPPCASYQTCQYINSLGEGRCINNQNPNGTFQTSGSQASSSGSGGVLQNPLNATSLPQLLGAVLQAVVALGTIFLVLMLVYVGFLFVAARGAPDKLTKAREALLWTVIGGLLLLGAEGLAIVLQSTVQAL